jgi:predicted metalloprotease
LWAVFCYQEEFAVRWEDFRRSSNIDDRRGEPGGGGPRFPGGRGGMGIGTILILGLIGWALGIDPRVLIGGAEIFTQNRPSPQAPAPSNRPAGTPTDEMGQFVSAVVGDTEDRWKVLFQQAGKQYQAPRLVLYNGGTRSACGSASSAMGPFYCPNDRQVYLDTDFFTELEKRFRGCSGKACQFSGAYVIAHEIGHHVQNQLGILPKVQQLQQQVDQADANQLQVMVELQADCFAGVWANQAQQKLKFIEPGDVEAAMQTATAIGDDTMQRKTQGRVVPDSFTHGSAEQRVRWFTTGLKSGNVSDCNTFAGRI